MTFMVKGKALLKWLGQEMRLENRIFKGTNEEGTT